ncbi:MAG: hypothetical protein AAB454_02050 [Patescibacteria group bacterium]
MRKIITIILSGLFIVVVIQVYNLVREKIELKDKLSAVMTEAGKLETENGALLGDIEYFGNPKNLAKEIKAKFNYKNPGEKLIIVVPEE